MPKLEIQSDVKPFTIIKNAIIDSENILNEHEKIMYIVLLRYGNKVFPSLATLSKKCGFSKSTAQRTIDTLIEKGLLKKKSRISKKNGNISNMYTLIDNDKIWYPFKKDIIENSRVKIHDKEKGLDSEPTKAQNQAHKNKNDKNKLSSQQQDTTPVPKSQELERYTLDQIKQLFDYDIMIQDNHCLQKDIDSVMDILYTTMNTTKSTIRIAGEDKPSMVVIGKLMKLNKESIVYAISKFSEQTEKIRNPAAYMLTILYNAPEQFNLYIQNQVQYNMHNWNNKDVEYQRYNYNELEKQLLG